MIYMLLDITFDVSCWVVVKASKLLYSGASYLTTRTPHSRPAIAYSGDKQRDIIYAAGILHHESMIDNELYQRIIDSSLLFSLKD